MHDIGIPLSLLTILKISFIVSKLSYGEINQRFRNMNAFDYL